MRKIIEALLYVKGNEGLTPRSFASIYEEMNTPTARKEMQKFMEEWNSEDHGMMVVEYKDHFKFATKVELHDKISELVTNEKKQRLSNAAIEAAGIIAYKQPITKSQVNTIRGVASEAVVNTLLIKGLIEEAGVAETPGRPILYKVSAKFYDYFNISSLKELPKLSEFEEGQEEGDFELFSSQRYDNQE
ncbi:SMC-Scp complex subunit ScpB [Mycoplasma todarodis]|uniref:Segregation and condensation protein B n=1 Tax=Mycoplasma todarodis TaxID=1937191 RepID=A0A4R0XR82_9MOLU|nr:SMC-Scp complex subunit ScpB [Mycoplasma todarodis]TCG10900.1 SMC-Scp complex subunit ScpB [Mycoplasma todarodis]